MAKSLAFAPTLVEVLCNSQVKVTESANETFGAWREGNLDNLDLASACAAWAAEHAQMWKLGIWLGPGVYVGE